MVGYDHDDNNTESITYILTYNPYSPVSAQF